MSTLFRENHLLTLLKLYESQSLPLDVMMGHYFRKHSAIGSKDRAEISEYAYAIFRWKGLIDFFSKTPVSWEERIITYKKIVPSEFLDSKEIPDHIKVSFPPELYSLLLDHFGPIRTREICLACNQPAPTTIRANPLKTNRDKLIERWKDSFEIVPCKFSNLGIVFQKKINFYILPEFKEGFFEVQDEASQLVSNLIDAKPGQLVLDFCAGAGGKTLAFAPKMQNQGQIYLHDIRQNALLEAKKRLRRAGIQNAQIIHTSSSHLLRLRKKMDWVLVDVPCSGTGTLRRNPDQKWHFNLETLRSLISTQRVIFEKALSYLKPGGKIVYATCSILDEENMQQIAHFQKTYGLSLVQDPFQSLPLPGEMDGFFSAVLMKDVYS